MVILGYSSAVLMGFVLGLIGGGGSILTVPIFVYLFGIEAVDATFYSLFVVGVSALAGVAPYRRRGLVDFRTGFTFIFPAIGGVALSRRLILPSIPDHFSFLELSVSKDALVLVAFASVMIAAAGSMIWNGTSEKPRNRSAPRPFLAILTGFGVGSVTGFVGAGGGFLIVPALITALKIPVQKAIGTSLLIIALNSLFGFSSDWASGYHVDWVVVVPFAAIALVGIQFGSSMNRHLSPKALKPAFGWFVLVIGGLILAQQLAKFAANTGG